MPRAVDDVVEAQLKHLQQVLARGARPTVGLGEHSPELPFEHAVGLADLLLLLDLLAVVGNLAAPRRTLAWWLVATLDGAFGAHAAFALEHQLFAGAAADAADGSGISSHWRFSLSVALVESLSRVVVEVAVG